MLTLARGGRRLADDAQIGHGGAQALAPHVHFGVLAVDLEQRAFDAQRANRDADAGLEIGQQFGRGRGRRRAGRLAARLEPRAHRVQCRGGIGARHAHLAGAERGRATPLAFFAQHGGARLQPVDHGVDLATRVAQLLVHLRCDAALEGVFLLSQRRLLPAQAPLALGQLQPQLAEAFAAPAPAPAAPNPRARGAPTAAPRGPTRCRARPR